MTKKKENITEEESNTLRLHINEDRINDAESLDTSFLEGREQKKVVKNQHEKEKILKESHVFDFEKIFKPIGVVVFLALLLGGVYYLYCHYEEWFHTDVKPIEEKEKTKIVYKMDDNYLFIGSFYTEDMDLEEFMYLYVKVSKDDMLTSDILEDMRENIYIYNPSAVILELGIIDLVEQVEDEEILSQLEEIIRGIQKNRPLAKIYVESLYPVNTGMDDYPEEYEEIDTETIIAFNEKLLEKMKSLDVTYINMFEYLSENNELKESYTEDGITLNEDGYKRIMKVLQKEFEKE